MEKLLRTLTVAKQIAEGLVEAHRLGVIHGDLKPQNIMIDHLGNAKIMDFGIARQLTGMLDLPWMGKFTSSPSFMALRAKIKR